MAGEPTVLSSIGYLADPNPARFRALAPHYRLDLGQTTGGFHWISHCEHCAALPEESKAFVGLRGPHEAGLYVGLMGL